MNSFIEKLTHVIPDKLYLYLKFRQRMGKWPNLRKPSTFNEKLQWLKLYDRNPIYTIMVDKYEVKKYVANIIGTEYIIPTLGVWDSFDQIDFNLLPNQFVLKCTHDSGGLVIVQDKNTFDKNRAKQKIDACMKRNYYWHGREWAYKDVKPRIIAEKYMENSKTGDLRDYKIFTFNGVVKCLFIATDRQKIDEDTKFDFFDADFRHLPLTNGHPNADVTPHKPSNFEEMKQLAEILGKDYPQMRIDFYEVNGKVYFGEITLSHWNGFTPFCPEKWDYTFGSWIDLSKSYGNDDV